jgi:hypothetical protein
MFAAKIIVAVPLALAALGVVVVALLPSHYEVERSITVRAPRADVAAAVADLSRRTDWIAWVATDPAARYVHTGVAGAPGSTLRFAGDKIGRATIALDHRGEDSVVTHIDFEAPMAMVASDRFVFEEGGGGETRVRWINSADVSGLGKLFGLAADRVLGPDYEAGLAKLKHNLETRVAGT